MFRRVRTTSTRANNRISALNLKNRSKRLFLQGLEERTVPTVYPVTNTLDDGSATSLRGAILLANADATAGPHTVDATGVSGTISLLTGQIPINNTAAQDIIINGPGSGSLTVAGNFIASATNRVFNNTGTAAVTISGMTLTGGNTTSGNSGGAMASGAGNLTLSDVTFFNNRSAATGGGLAVAALNTTVVSLTNTNFVFNITTSTSGGGGAIFGTSATNAPLSVTLNGCRFAFNNAAGSGAGMYLFSTTAVTSLSVDNSAFMLNSGTSGVSVYVAGSPTLAEFKNSQFHNNTGSSNAGAIYFASTPTTIDIQTCDFRNNVGSSGGAIYYSSSPPAVTVNESTFSGNTSSSSHGGAMYFFTGGSATITNNTFVNNSSGSTGDGGAVAIWTTTTTFSNNTFTGNKALGSGGGGAISVRSSAASLILTNNTIVGNTNSGGTLGGGGVRISSATTVSTFDSNIIAGNTSAIGGVDIHTASSYSIAGTNNFIGAADGGNYTLSGSPNQTGTKATPIVANLRPLALHGGSTMIMPPISGGVIDMGSNPLALSYDQRGVGFNRKVGTQEDVGAAEGADVQLWATYAGPTKITAAGATPNTLDIVYADDTGVDVTTIGTDDITITAPNGTLLAVTGATFSPAGNGTPRTATYTFTVPGGAWDYLDSGVYTVKQVAGKVSDIDGSPTTVAGGILGTFAVTVGQSYVVNLTSDTGAGAGNMGDLRYVLSQSNGTVGLPDTITFDGAVFTAGTTITMVSAAPTISDSVIITGPGVANAKIVGTAKTGFVVNANLNVTITDMEISGLSRAGAGGAIQTLGNSTLTLNNMVFSGNTSSSTGGGALAPNASGAKIVVTNSTFTGNKVITSTTADGGAIRGTTGSILEISKCTFTGNTVTDDGGAIYSTGGAVTILSSSFSANTTAKAAGNDGGAITYTGTVPAGGFTIRNSTFSGNSASSGGAMLFSSGMTGTATITNTTFTLNGFTSVTGNGGAINRQGGTLVFESVIMSGNISAAPPANGPDLFSAAAVTMNTSAIGTSTGFTVGSGSGNFIGTPVSLGALQPNGTHIPTSGSFVYNNGSNPAGLLTDQAGASRTQQLFTDIGAVEATGVDPVFHMTSLGPILTAGATPDQVVITYSDDNAIDWTSIGISDIEIVAPDLSKLTITNASPDAMVDGPNRVVTYTFAVPVNGASGWDGSDNGTYTVNILGTEVADKDGTVKYVAAATAGTFQVGVPASYVVDNSGDVDNGIYTAGDFTLREALKLANVLPVSHDTITFGGAAFAGATTITLTSGLTVGGNVTITGTGASNLTVSGATLYRIFSYTDASQVATFNLNSIKLAGGKSGAGGGGAILMSTPEILNITNCVLDSNNASAANGGAMSFPAGGTITITSSTISNNSTTAGPGGAIDGNAGGGILNITESTFTGNKAPGNRGGAVSVASFTTNIVRSTFSGTNSAANGGALSFYGTGVTVIANTTISGNSASTMGGGIQLQSFGGVLDVRNSTITANVSSGANGGGIGQTSGAGTISLYSTIVYGNTNAGSPDVFTGTTVNADYVDLGSSTGIATLNITNSPAVGTNPLLGALQSNGGPTQTHALLPGSPAVDAGDNAVGSYLTDQRGAGYPRILAAKADIGAFEGIDAAPSGSWTPIGPITTPGATPNQITVSWADDVAIDWTSLGTDDISIKAPDGSFLVINAAVPSQMTNGTPISVLYTFTVPGGAWGNTLDSGIYTVEQVGGKVLDSGASPTLQATLGTFLVDLPGNYVVDEATDISDGNFGVGKLSFREAVERSNATTSSDTISFDATVFNVAKSIAQATEIKITSPVEIKGPAASLTYDATGFAGVRLLNIDVTGSSDNKVSIDKLTLKGGSNTTGSIMLIVDEDVTFTNVTITNGTASPAVYLSGTTADLKATGSSFTNNNSGSTGGGAIRVNPSGTSTVVELNDCTLSGNTSTGSGGAIYFNWNGTLTVSGTTFSNNKGGTGGAVTSYQGTATFTNTTFYNNVGTSGGAIGLNSTGASATLNNCTVVGNSASSNGGGLARTSSYATGFTLNNTIVASNKVGANQQDIYYSSAGAVNGDYNLVGVADVGGFTLAGANNLTGTQATPLDPQLAAFGNYGGPTQTFVAASSLSPGVNKGDPGFTPPPTLDQRGQPRVAGGTIDIGSTEGFLTNPTAKFNTFPTITVAASTPDTLTVTYSDDSAINYLSIDINDITITGPAPGFVNLPVTGAVVDILSNGTPRIATYTFTVPGGGWDALDNGIYTVAMKASEVTDDTALPVFPGTLGTFSVGIAANYLVDEATDINDGMYGVGKLSLREAVVLASADPVSNDTISFDATVFNVATSIVIASQMPVSGPVSINGPAAQLTLDASGSPGIRHFFVDVPSATAQPVSMSKLRLINGSATDGGSAIRNFDEALSLTDMVIQSNSGDGAVVVDQTIASLNATRCSFISNTGGGGDVGGGGAAIFIEGASGNQDNVVVLTDCTFSGNAPTTGPGGAIYFYWGGKATISGSTFNNNSTTTNGGAIALYNASANIANSTFNLNSATAYGGAISFISGSASATLNNSTVSGNVAGTNGGGIGRNSTYAGGITLNSSIVAANTAATGADIWSTDAITTGGDYNLVGVADSVNLTVGGTNNKTGTTATPLSPNLDVLASNGGPTQTMALKAGSQAIDNGDNSVLTLTYDQRGVGYPRTIGAKTDIGAYEKSAALPPTVTTVIPNGGGAQRSNVFSIVVTFSESVSFSGAVVNAFTLTRANAPLSATEQPGVNGKVNIVAAPVTGPTNTVTLTFATSGAEPVFGVNNVYPTPPNSFVGYSLPDGTYNLAIDGTQVSGVGGNMASYSQTGSSASGDKLYRLFGDLNGDGAVSNSDFNAFKVAFAGGVNVAFDYNNDGDVANNDFNQLKTRFGSSMP